MTIATGPIYFGLVHAHLRVIDRLLIVTSEKIYGPGIGANNICVVSHMLPLLHAHAFVPPRLIVIVRIVPSQAPLEDHSRVHSNCRECWVCETTVTAHGIRVTTSAIGLVTNRLGHGAG